MISRRFPAWQKLVALAPLFLLAVYLPGQMMLRCRIDGLLRPTCCCPVDKGARNAGPVVKAQDCCDREMTAGERPVIEPARSCPADTTWAAFVALPLPAVSFALAEPVRSERAWLAHGPPREGPQIVLLKHAFLI